MTLVEGCGATTNHEFARFLEMSIKSTMELEEQLELAKDNAVMLSTTWRTLTYEAVSVRRQLCALKTRVLGNDDGPSNVSDP